MQRLTKTFIYKLTNNVCTRAFDGGYQIGVNYWRTATEAALEFPMQMNEVGVLSLHTAEYEIARLHQWHVIDPRTDQMCDCTGIHDGRNYPTLVPAFVVALRAKAHPARMILRLLQNARWQ